jgi:DNA-binding protein YbaB
MGSVFIIRGILIYIYGFDHNPPHIHVQSANGEFTITIKDRIVEGKGKAKEIKIINEFIDEHEEELLEIFEKAQRGEPIKKVQS